MNITLKKLDKKSPEIPFMKQLYISAFPEDERAPFKMLLNKSSKPGVDFLGIYDGDSCIGMFYVVSYLDLSYLFYFAISDEERGKGYGSAALSALKDRYAGQRLFLAAEATDEPSDNPEERIRRKNFYMRNGFRDVHRKLREGGVIYEILAVGGEATPAEYKRLIKRYLGVIMSLVVRVEMIEK